MKFRYLLFLIFLITLTGCGSTMRNSTWKTTDGYKLKISGNSCTISKNGKVYKNKCTFEYNANGTGKNVITICNDEYGHGCQRVDYLNDDWSTFHIFGRDWYKE